MIRLAEASERLEIVRRLRPGSSDPTGKPIKHDYSQKSRQVQLLSARGDNHMARLGYEPRERSPGELRHGLLESRRLPTISGKRDHATAEMGANRPDEVFRGAERYSTNEVRSLEGSV